jgi:hypothetical protein
LREAFGRDGVRELGTEGDSIYFVFESAVEANELRLSMSISRPDDLMLERFMGPARTTVTTEQWDAEQFAGRALSDQRDVEPMTADKLRQVI